MAIMKYETKITLYNSYFDVNDNLKIQSILAIFQDVASIHAGLIGVGYEEMKDKNLYWVLSRVKFDIVSMLSVLWDDKCRRDILKTGRWIIFDKPRDVRGDDKE